MTIPDFPELTFEDKPHLYCLNGQPIPSVSRLMEPLSRSLYKTVDPEVLAMAAHRGTVVHEAIENHIRYGIEDIPAAYAGYFDGYLRWCKEHQVTAYGTECRVYHPIMRYAGTVDLPCLCDGKVTLVDLKTSASVNGMLTGVQLEAYERAFNAHGVTFEQKAILHLTRSGKYEFVLYPSHDAESYEVFSALHRVWMHIQKYQGGK